MGSGPDGADGAQRRSCSVAVVGAGAAGLAAARELLREGHAPVVFEQGRATGGVWVYDDAVDADSLGSACPKDRVHSSMYQGLRTNLPREVMSFTAFPFTPEAIAAAGGASSDTRRFPSHGEVLSYLRAYAQHYGLARHVRFNTRVVHATPVWGPAGAGAVEGAPLAADACGEERPVTAGCGLRWRLTLEVLGANGNAEQHQHEQEFDALVVCNGHYSATNVPQVEGADVFPGAQLHSHNYRSPAPFAGQTVLVVGASNSGEDLCREIASVAERVLICARSWKNSAWATDDTPFGPRANIERRGMVTRLTAAGGAEFASGAPVAQVDAVVYATGYRYDFPFLEGSVLQPQATAGGAGGGDAGGVAAAGAGAAPGLLSTRDQRVAPLYQHMFYPDLAPTLAFVGLPWKVVPFPQFELQSRLVARLLSGAASLPSRREMREHSAAFYKGLEQAGVPPRWTHMLGDQQWEYNDWLADAAACESSRLPPWRSAMYASTGLNKRAHPEDYRDRWEDTASLEQAEAELTRLVAEVAAVGPADGCGRRAAAVGPTAVTAS